MKKSKADKMYGNPPEAETDEKGNTTVKPGKADQTQSGTEGMAQGVEHAQKMREMHHRHETEHMAMNRRHEVEMDAGGEIEKHITEHKEMTQRHHAEVKKSHGGHKGGGEPVTKKDTPEEKVSEKKAKPEKGGEKA